METKIDYRVYSKTVPTWLFALLLASTEKFRFATCIRILKIDLEIAEIIEVKVGNHHFEIYILLVQRQKKKFYVKVGNFNLNYLSHF